MTEFLDEGTHDEFEFSFLIDFRLVDFVVLIGWFWLFILARDWFLGTIAFQLRFLWRIFPFDTNPAPGGSRFAPSNWLTLRFYSYTLLLGLGFFWPLTSPRGQSDVQSVWTRDIGGPAPRVAIDWAVIYLYYQIRMLNRSENGLTGSESRAKSNVTRLRAFEPTEWNMSSSIVLSNFILLPLTDLRPTDREKS